MLHISKKTKLATLAAVCLILFAGTLRLVQWGSWRAVHPPLACLGEMIYVGLLLSWGISLDHRLTDRRVKGLLFTSIALMILWFVLRCAKYDFFDAYDSVLRWLWYGYYIPMNLLPTLSLLAARRIGVEEGRSLRSEPLLLLLIPDALFTVLVLTNDCHQLVFGFQSGFENWSGDYTHLPLYFVLWGWMAVRYVGALGIIFYKCRISRSRRFVWLPLTCLLVIAIFSIWYNATQFLSFPQPFLLTETLCIVFAALWESCIQIGLIPSNIGYQEFFNASTVDAQIVDSDGQVRFSSEGAASLTDSQRRFATAAPLLLEPDIQLQSRATHGGRVFWKDDLTVINTLNRELEEARSALAEENDLIRAENEIKADQARLREQNRLYDYMADSVRPQLEEIRRLIGDLSPCAHDFSQRLGKACVLNAYIKRRSNLMLLSEKETMADVTELSLCIRESMEYLAACGVLCSYQQDGTGSLRLGLACRAYDWFEMAIEPALPELHALLVRLSMEKGIWSLRMVMDGPTSIPGAVEQDGTLYLTFRLDEGVLL